MFKQEIKEFIRENFNLAEEYDLRDDISFIDNGIIDSTGILEVVSFIEEKFNFQINDDDLVPENLDSIENILGFLKKQQLLQ